MPYSVGMVTLGTGSLAHQAPSLRVKPGGNSFTLAGISSLTPQPVPQDLSLPSFAVIGFPAVL